MTVQNPAGGGQKGLWHSRAQVLGNAEGPFRADANRDLCRNSIVVEGRTGSAPFGLVGDEAVVITIGAAQIELEGAAALAILNGLPQDHGHAAEMVKLLIGAAVLVNQGRFVAKGDNGRDGLRSERSHANTKRIAQGVQKIAEPTERLRRKTVAAAGENREAIELAQEIERAALFIAEVFALGAVNFALDTALVKAVEESGQLRPKIEALPNKGIADAAIGGIAAGRRIPAQWTKFDIAAVRDRRRIAKRAKHGEERIRIVDEWLAMIGERQGNEARAGEPAFDPAENKSVPQGIAGRGRCADQRLISIGELKSAKPSGSVEDGTLRMPVNKLVPTRIGERIELIDAHFSKRKQRETED